MPNLSNSYQKQKQNNVKNIDINNLLCIYCKENIDINEPTHILLVLLIPLL